MRRPAASCPAPRPRTSSSTPCPSSCNGRASARCRSRFPPTPSRTGCRRAFPPSISTRRSPLPSAWPRQSPRSIGPAGRKIAGRFMLIAPISNAGRRLVAAAHQHGAVRRIRAQQLLGLHRQQVAIEHRRRLLERLGQRDRRHLDRKSARLPDAALHFLGALAEMRVARVDVAPRVDDRDHRLAEVIRCANSPSARCASDGRTSACRRRHTSGASAGPRDVCGRPSSFDCGGRAACFTENCLARDSRR